MVLVPKVDIIKGKLQFSRFVLGMWRMESWGRTPQENLTFIKEALELGISTIDEAPVYESEHLLGEALLLDKGIRKS